MARGKKSKKQNDEWSDEKIDENIISSQHLKSKKRRQRRANKVQSMDTSENYSDEAIDSTERKKLPSDVDIPDITGISKGFTSDSKKKMSTPVSFALLEDTLSQQDESEEELAPKSKAKNAFEILDDDASLNKSIKKKKNSTSKQGLDEKGLAESLEDLSLGKKKKPKKKKRNDTGQENEETLISHIKPLPKFIDADEKEALEKSSDGTFVSKSENLTATGMLLSHERSKDVQIDKFSVAAFGQQLVNDTTLNLIYGKRYGLVGSNGCGKSTLLRCIAHREVPIQSNIDLYLLEKEYDPTELTAVEAVVEIVKTERDNLEEEMVDLLETVEGAESARMEFINERLRELDLSFAEQKARNVLHGLGFSEEMQDMKTSEFSGGWRMRVALARALFVKPTILLLDDATNHLDLSAVVWLEEYLASYPHTILMVSHSSDFLNGICTDIMYLHNRKLDYFSGNYDNFLKVKAELDEALRKKLKADEKKMKKIKENLGRTGKQAKQAKAQEKMVMKQREKDGSGIDRADLRQGRPVTISFMDCGGGLPSPFLKFNDVGFAYPGRKQLYHSLNFGLDLNSRVALVGPNGAGKSTLMKLMCGDLEATEGEVTRHHHLRIARFHQHLTEQLDLSVSAIEWMCREFGNIKAQEMRKIVGRFGLTGKSQVIPMYQLSDGQKRRVVFAWLSQKNCHLLMLDEPTNFLDMETIDALAEGIINFDGGVVLISHDFRLINQVAEEIWVVDKGTVTPWHGDIQEYKDHLRKTVGEAAN